MGFRTVVILYNDQANEWENDPELGKRISRASHDVTNLSNRPHDRLGRSLSYGRVVECTHADNETLAVIESYSMHALAHSMWHSSESPDGADRDIKLLRDAAKKYGFRLVRQSKPKNLGDIT